MRWRAVACDGVRWRRCSRAQDKKGAKVPLKWVRLCCFSSFGNLHIPAPQWGGGLYGWGCFQSVMVFRLHGDLRQRGNAGVVLLDQRQNSDSLVSFNLPSLRDSCFHGNGVPAGQMGV